MSEEIQSQNTEATVTESADVAPQSASSETTITTAEANWRDTLPEDIRSEPSLASFKDPGALAKSYVSAQKMLGGSIRIPSQDASQEDRDAFYSKLDEIPGIIRVDEDNPVNVFNRLGRPELADQYEFMIDESVANELSQYVGEGQSPISEEALQVYKEWAHEAGLTQQQATALFNQKLQDEIVELEYRNQQAESARSLLQKTWGADYDNRFNAAKSVLSHYESQHPDAIAELKQSAGNNPALAMILADYGKSMMESGIIEGTAKGSFGRTPEEAKAQIEEIRRNPSHPYHNRRDPEHRAAVEKMQKLYRDANPQ